MLNFQNFTFFKVCVKHIAQVHILVTLNSTTKGLSIDKPYKENRFPVCQSAERRAHALGAMTEIHSGMINQNYTFLKCGFSRLTSYLVSGV